MKNQKEVSINTLILGSILFLFLAFIIIQPIDLTGNVILPLVGETNDIPTPTLIGAIAVLVVIWILVVVLHRRLKKKEKLEKLPGLPGLPEPVSTIEIPTVQEIQKRQGLTEEELKQLFREIAPKIEPIPQAQPSQSPLFNIKELEFFEQQQKKLNNQIPDLNKLSPQVLK